MPFIGLWLNVIIRFVLGAESWEGIINASRRVARIWKRGGGAFLKKWENCKRPWPELSLFLNQNHTVYPISADLFLKLRRKFRPKSEIQTLFQPKNRWSHKKRSSPKLRRIFRPKSEIQTLFQAESRHLLHNFGTQFRLGGGVVFIFSPKIGLKSTKNMRFCLLHRPMGGALAPPGYATECFRFLGINLELHGATPFMEFLHFPVTFTFEAT